MWEKGQGGGWEGEPADLFSAAPEEDPSCALRFRARSWRDVALLARKLRPFRTTYVTAAITPPAKSQGAQYLCGSRSEKSA